MRLRHLIPSLALLLFAGSAAAATSYQTLHIDPALTTPSITYAPTISATDAQAVQYWNQTRPSSGPSYLQEIRNNAKVAQYLPQRGSLIARTGHEERPYYAQRRPFTASVNQAIYQRAYELCMADKGTTTDCTADVVVGYIFQSMEEKSTTASTGMQAQLVTAYARRMLLDGIRYQDENTRTQVKGGLQKVAQRYTGQYHYLPTAAYPMTAMPQIHFATTGGCTYNAATGAHTCQMYNPTATEE